MDGAVRIEKNNSMNKTLKTILLYLSIFLIWIFSTFLIVSSNFFEFNFPMSLMLLPIPFIAALILVFYLKRK
jgi:low temperature requirement protein LtrA